VRECSIASSARHSTTNDVFTMRAVLVTPRCIVKRGRLDDNSSVPFGYIKQMWILAGIIRFRDSHLKQWGQRT